MTWLFSKALMMDFENSRSLQAQGVEYSEGNFSDGERFAELNVTPTPHKFWRNDKTMEFSNLSRFGLTCAVLTESRGEELLTWYLAGFHAKTLAQQEKAQELKAQKAECGKKWHVLLAKYDQDTHSWKTAQCSLLEDLELSLQTWPRWGSMRNMACYQQPMLAQITLEKESGYWLTPRASDTGKGESNETFLVRMGDRTENTAKAKFPNLETVVARIIFPTPTAHNAREGSFPSEHTRNTPSLATHAGGALNPNWTEWLMGWPIGWTDLKPLAMDKCHFALQQHLNCFEIE
jgi:hypothetical protein